MMKIFIVDPWGERACATRDELTKAKNTSYEIVADAFDAYAIVVIGGDSSMLRAIDQYKLESVPFFGINRGHVGFLLNKLDFLSANLSEVIATSKSTKLWSIKSKITWLDGSETCLYGFNDVYVNPSDGQALKMKLTINDIELNSELVGDGVVVSTPQGSTGYNRTAGGVIVSPESNLIQLAPKLCTIGKERELASTFVEHYDTTFKIDFIDHDIRTPRVFADGIVDSSRTSGCYPTSIEFSRTESDVTLLFKSDQSFYDKVFGAKYRK